MLVPYSKLSDYNIKKIMKHFVADCTATQTAKLLPFNRNTINRYHEIFRCCIAWHQDNALANLRGEIEVDESYFGARRVRGKRGRGALGKTIVFGILERNGEIYTEIVPNVQLKTLQRIIRGHVDFESIIYSDGRPGYNGLVEVGYDKHRRVIHSKNEFSKYNGTHINGIEAFRSFCKRRLAKFNGVKVNFYLHIKECERRYCKNDNEMYEELLKITKKYSPFI